MRCTFRLFLTGLVWSCSLAAQSVTPDFKFQPSYRPGDPVTINGTGLDKVTSATLQAAGKAALPPINVTASANSVSFKAPADPGQYTVTLNPAVAGIPALTVAAPAAPAPQAPASPAPEPLIDSVFPATTYPIRDRFNFDINGRNFDPDPNNDGIDVLGQGTIQFKSRFQSATPASAHNPGEAPRECSQVADAAAFPCLEATADGRKLIVYGYPRGHAYQGPMEVRVFTKSGMSGWSASFTLSRVNYRIVVAVSFGIFALLMYIVYRLVTKGMQDYTVAGRSYSPLAGFLIDKTTDTYSLSKFQLLALSMVAFFGYVYVFLCRVLVQWQFAFPDIPDNYPTLLAISAGTTAAAAGLQAARGGGNGGGPVHPGPADFICNGGAVVADRFQFFVWTLIACIGFIALILLQDPATVSGFPSFPNGLLYVMGVSAAGYLGGKAVRNPGPTIKRITVAIGATNSADLDVVLDGANLDKDAKFRIDGAAQTSSGTVGWSQAAGEPAGYSDQLKFTLTQAAGFFNGDHTLELVNGDGIGAQGIFTGRPMKITNATPPSIPHGTTSPVGLEVTDFREKSSARWLAPGASAAVEIPVSDVGPAVPPPSPGQMSKVPVKIPAGAATGPGTLTLVTPVGGTEATPVNVV